MLSPPTQQQVSLAIQKFLDEQYHKKGNKDLKKLEQALADNNAEAAEKLQATLSELKDKYYLDNWLKDAAKMATQLYFGTHTSKGIHSDAKGDNIIFSRNIQHDYVGTHSVNSQLLDANGNAAALPLAAFFDYPVTEYYRMRDVILQCPDSIRGCLGSDANRSEEYQQLFYDCLSRQPQQPKTHERNKQILWPISHDDDCYHVLVPLHPSVLTHELYQNIQQRRWSDEAKTARENRKTPSKEQFPYQDIMNLATVKLGGTKPQNISLLNSRQGGVQYLLPSIPPRFLTRDFYLPKGVKSLFSSASYKYRMRPRISALLTLFNLEHNTIHIRNARDGFIAEILADTFHIATKLQQQPTGWSKDYLHLDKSQKIWLDPDNEEQSQFKLQSDWKNEIANQFAHWLQAELINGIKSTHKLKKSDFADPEFHYWKNEIEEAIKASQRLGEGVFQ